MASKSSSWLVSGLENVAEQRNPIPLRVHGKIPTWLSGSLYRTGPGTFNVQPEDPSKPVVNLAHWFDGLGMNHRFRITSDGQVYYSSHSSAARREDQIKQKGYVPGITFGGRNDPCDQIFSKFFTLFKKDGPQENAKSQSQPPPDDDNVSVTLTPNLPGLSSHNATKEAANGGLRYLVAKTDANLLQVLDPETLEPLEITTYAKLDKRLDGQTSAAHSCRDPETGEFFNYVARFGAVPFYRVFKVKEEQNSQAKNGGFEVQILADIKDAPMAYMHSFVLTKKYVVLCIWQSDYALNGAALLQKRSMMGALKKWNPKRDTLFYVIDREKGGVVAKYKSPTFFTFHAINAYDSHDSIVIDLTCYEDNSILNLLYLDHMRNPTPDAAGNPSPITIPNARRFVLENISQAQAGTTRDAKVAFDLLGLELPTIHPNKYGSPYRYVYGIYRAEPDVIGVFTDKIIKLDMTNPDPASSTHKTWGAEGYTTGEPIFIPRPGAKEEDDGVVLSVVLDGKKQRSMLTVLDAKDLKEIARAEMQTAFPLGFHGVFTDSQRVTDIPSVKL